MVPLSKAVYDTYFIHGQGYKWWSLHLKLTSPVISVVKPIIFRFTFYILTFYLFTFLDLRYILGVIIVILPWDCRYITVIAPDITMGLPLYHNDRTWYITHRDYVIITDPMEAVQPVLFCLGSASSECSMGSCTIRLSFTPLMLLVCISHKENFY